MGEDTWIRATGLYLRQIRNSKPVYRLHTGRWGVVVRIPLPCDLCGGGERVVGVVEKDVSFANDAEDCLRVGRVNLRGGP